MNTDNAQTNKPIALISGANRGLGFATAKLLATAGASVIIGARDRSLGAAAAEDLRRDGFDADHVQLDVSSDDSVIAAADEITRRHGVLDILVNNAGILPEATTPNDSGALRVEMFQATFDTNVFGVVRVIDAMLPLLRRSAAGRIVNVSSTMGSLADQSDPASPYYGLVVPAYQTSKAALNGLTIALAKSLADTTITINSVCPGWVQTDLGGPDNRAAAPLTADEAAEVVVRTALCADGDATGRFFDRAGSVAW